MTNKDASKVGIRFAMCFPDVYEIGMSHLGIQILYSMFNKWDDIYCEHVYSPQMDLDSMLGGRRIPSFTLEIQKPVKGFDSPDITLQYEMCYTNVLQILDLSGIPLHACDRTEEGPIVVGEGPCACNPESLADLFNIFYIGEGETVYFDLMGRHRENKKTGGGRHRFLEPTAEIPGIYVPALYDVTYKEDGTTESFLPNNSHAMPVIIKQMVRNMDDVGYIETSLVPFTKMARDRVVLETQRGCIRDCHFYRAGNVYRPLREHSPEHLKKHARGMLKNTGSDEISLSSLSSSDYSQLEGLMNSLIDEFEGKGVNISLPSLRTDAFSLDVISKVQDIKKSSLTFMPEAGSQRLKDVINKGLAKRTILEDAKNAFEVGWDQVRLYLTLGLPTETVEDMGGIALLSEKIVGEYYEIPKDRRNGKVQIMVSSSFSVPKPFTPFQWAGMCTKEEFTRWANIICGKFREIGNYKSLEYNWHEVELIVSEGTLARGDRRMGTVIEEVYRTGAICGSWSEYFNNGIWMKASKIYSMDIGSYTTRERSLEEVFPWDFINAGVTKEFLIREWNTAVKGQVTPDCRQTCSGCGARYFGTGMRYEVVKEQNM